MEPVRPLVDRYVLRLLAARTFSAADFFETRQGVCRVTPPLARELAQTIPEWARAAGRVAEDVADRLSRSGGMAGRHRRHSPEAPRRVPARQRVPPAGAVAAAGGCRGAVHSMRPHDRDRAGDMQRGVRR